MSIKTEACYYIRMYPILNKIKWVYLKNHKHGLSDFGPQ